MAALSIQNNSGAMSSQRYMGISSAGYQTSVERMVSGFKINRASDDPAGLVNSENMRTQIMGMTQAISNSTDAVNMIKTAEAALDEVTTQLKAMRTLAQHASNVGVNDATATAADQASIKSSIEALNRISATTQFGTKKLLDGSSGVTGSSSNSEVSVVSGTGATKGGTYAVNITTVAKQATAISTGRNQQQITGAVTGANNITGADYGVLRFGGALVNNGSAYDIRVASTDTVQSLVDKINNDAVLSRAVRASVDSAGTSLVFTSTHTSAAAGAVTAVAVAGSGTGTAANVTTFTGVANAAALTSTAINAKGSALLNFNESLTLTDNINGKSTTVKVVAGDSLDVAVSKINAAAANAGINVKVELQGDATLKWTNTNFGTSTYAQVTVADAAVDAVGANLVAGKGNLGIGGGNSLVVGTAGAQNDYTGVAGVNVAGTINSETATGAGNFLTGNSGNANTEGLKLRIDATYVPAGGDILAQVTVQQNSSTFQIGANAGQTAGVSIDSTDTSKLGTSASGLVTKAKSVADIDVTSLNGAQDAMRILDEAIKQISTQRSSLGAFQKNSLESNIKSLTIARENLTNSEGDIRNTDFTVESTNFAKFSVLQQAGTAMLAQANQAGQQVLTLMRG
ncbi:MAG TPA: flagellin [Armatimonadota bacterium]|jgi:flagellin